MEGLNAIPPQPEAESQEVDVQGHEPNKSESSGVFSTAGTLASSLEAISALLDETLEKARPKDFTAARRPYDRNEPAAGSVVISGTGFSFYRDAEGEEGEGVSEKIAGLVTTAALSALKDGGIPLIQREVGEFESHAGPAPWVLPEPLRLETGVITAPGYPGQDQLARIQKRYEAYKQIVEHLKTVNSSGPVSEEKRSRQIKIVVDLMRSLSSGLSDDQDPNLTMELLTHDYGQLAGLLEVQGPAAHLTPAGMCASEAIALADDWIQAGRCRRVIIVCTTEVTGDALVGWLSEQAQGDGGDGAPRIGAFSLLVESEDALFERGMRGIVEILGSEHLAHSASGDQDLVDHVVEAMERLVDGVERRFALYRVGIAPHMAFLTGPELHSTKGHPIGVAALQSVFGASAAQVVISSTSQMADKELSAALGTAISLKILESGRVPPAPNGWLEIPALDPYRLSSGSRTWPQYLLYITGLSQSKTAINLFRLISRDFIRVDSLLGYHRWVEDISGYDQAFVETGQHMLRLVGQSAYGRKPKASMWRYGVGPSLLAPETEPIEPEVPVDVVTEVPAELVDVPAGTTMVDELQAEAFALLEKGHHPLDVEIMVVAAAHLGWALADLVLDQDLKSELGLGEKEHAELLIDICQTFDVSGFADFNAGHYRTLAHMIALVRARRPDLLISKPRGDQGRKAEFELIPTVEGAFSRGELITIALEIVSDNTGYTAEILRNSLDLRLDEDMGIDALEKREIFQGLCHAFRLEPPGTQQLITFPTLSHIVTFILTALGDEGSPDELLLIAKSPTRSIEPVDGVSMAPREAAGVERPVEFAIGETLLSIAAEYTGIPPGEIDLAADLINDFGLDENTQAELVSSVLDSFGIPQPAGLHPSDYPSIGALIVFVRMCRPDLVDSQLIQLRRKADIPVRDVFLEEEAAVEAPVPVNRFVPSPAQLPPLIECVATGITLPGKRIVIISDRGGAGDELVSQLLEEGAAVLPLSATLEEDVLEERILSWLEQGPIDGLYWLPALDSEPALVHMSLGTWRELNRQKVKNLHRTMRVLYDSINHRGAFLVAATRLGGLHGLGYSDVTNPLGGSVSGFVKAYKVEKDQPEAGRPFPGSPLVKIVDFAVDQDDYEVASALIAETISDPESVEIGYLDNERHGTTLVEIDAPNGEPGLELGEESIYVVTGAARQLAGKIIGDLAVNGGKFYLLDLVGAPRKDNPKIDLYRSNKKALRELLTNEIRRVVTDPSAAMIEKLVSAIEMEDRVLKAIESVEQNGGTAHYACVDLLDESAIRALIGDIHKKHGRIDVLVHAAGMEMSRMLPEKDSFQFDMVYDVRADGFYNLLRAADRIPLAAVVVFGSMASWLGSWGQCDSNAVDELLRKMTGSLAWQRPETRSIAATWLKAFDDGTSAADVNNGIQSSSAIDFSFLRRELIAGSYRGEVIFQPGQPA